MEHRNRQARRDLNAERNRFYGLKREKNRINDLENRGTEGRKEGGKEGRKEGDDDARKGVISE